MINIEKFLEEQGFKKLRDKEDEDIAYWDNDNDAIYVEVGINKKTNTIGVYEESNVCNTEPEIARYNFDVETEFEKFKECITTLQKDASKFIDKKKELCEGYNAKVDNYKRGAWRVRLGTKPKEINRIFATKEEAEKAALEVYKNSCADYAEVCLYSWRDKDYVLKDTVIGEKE